MRSRFLLSLAILGIVCCVNRADAQATAAKPAIAVGQPFPTLVLPSLNDGRPMSIADFRGKKVILHIFASW